MPKWSGPMLSEGRIVGASGKDWLDFDQQIDLLRERGLEVEDDEECIRFLQNVGYYRLSGYFRYWQKDPAHQGNTFKNGATFNQVRELYLTERRLADGLAGTLRKVEVALATRFAHAYGREVAEEGGLARGQGFTLPSNPETPPVDFFVCRDLDRSKEPFIEHYRDKIPGGVPSADAYDRLPVWVAVCVLSFGTLSRCLAASGESGVLNAVAESVGVKRRYFDSQVRSLVYLRNRIAHHARLWNHIVTNSPGMAPNIRRRMQQNRGAYAPQSVYEVCVVLSMLAEGLGVVDAGYLDRIDESLKSHDELNMGLRHPKKC